MPEQGPYFHNLSTSKLPQARNTSCPGYINILQFTRRRAADTFQKLLKSAIANAEENHKVLDVEDLFIKTVTVDEGVTWKRHMPRARGTSTMIQIKTSHITLVLEEKES